MLDSIDEIVLNDYVAENISETLEDSVDLESIIKAKGVVFARSDAEKTAKLVVKVDAYNQVGSVIEFDSVKLEGRSDSYKYSIVGDSAITYNLYGLNMDIDMLDYNKLAFSLNVSGLEPGTHVVNLQMETSQKVQLSEDVPVKIKIEEK